MSPPENATRCHDLSVSSGEADERAVVDAQTSRCYGQLWCREDWDQRAVYAGVASVVVEDM
jgi:hypothetical protein